MRTFLRVFRGMSSLAVILAVMGAAIPAGAATARDQQPAAHKRTAATKPAKVKKVAVRKPARLKVKAKVKSAKAIKPPRFVAVANHTRNPAIIPMASRATNRSVTPIVTAIPVQQIAQADTNASLRTSSAASIPAGKEGITARMAELVRDNRYAEAYELGKSASRYFGDAGFDLNYGIAAVNSGHPSQGVLALERSIRLQPENSRARLEMGKGFFALAEDSRARRELEQALQSATPAEKIAIDDLLAAIERRRPAEKIATAGRKASASKSNAFAEFGIGHDSNINNGPSETNVSLPTFGAVSIPAGGRAVRADYGTLRAGGSGSTELDPGLQAFGAFDARSRFIFTSNLKAYDQNQLNGAAGLVWDGGATRYRAGIGGGILQYANAPYMDSVGVFGDIEHMLDATQTIGGGIQFAQMNYASLNAARNADYAGIQTLYRTTVTGGPVSAIVAVTGALGQETNSAGRPDLGRTITSANASATAPLAPGIEGGFRFGIQQSQYSAADVMLNTTRADDLWLTGANMVYHYSPSISVGSEVAYSNNRSNIAIYSYERSTIDVKVRYDF